MYVTSELFTGLFWGFTVASIIGSLIFLSRDKNMKYISPNAKVITQYQWENIEKNFAAEITKAKSNGIALGRKQIIDAMEKSLETKKSVIELRRPYQVLNLKVGQETQSTARATVLIEDYEKIRDLTDDKEIQDLCVSRIELIKKAERKLLSFIGSYSRGNI